MKNLDSIFNPKTVAIIGASNKKETVGYGLFKNLSNSGRQIYAVNPNHQKIQGFKSYSTIAQIKEKIDLAVVAVPAKITPQVIEECGQKGVTACILISSGFKEIGAKGRKLEMRIKKIINRYKMELLGPNCLGVINTGNNLNASFATKMPPQGKVVVLSQSGALGSAIIEWASEQNVGINTFVSLGDMLDINFADLIEYFGQKPGVSGIIIYMETVKDTQRFVDISKKVIFKKPIIVLKAGNTQAGKKATASHTGSLAGDAQVYQAVFRQLGILPVKEIDEIFAYLRILSGRRLAQGPRLAIVTNAGAGGVIATDTLIQKGGKMAELSPQTFQKLNKNLPSMWSGSNPVDILGDADSKTYEIAIKTCLKDPNVDGILVIFTSQYGSQPVKTAKALSKISQKYKKLILASWVGRRGISQANRILSQAKIPNYPTPEKAVTTFVNMWNYKKNLAVLKFTDKRPKNLGLNQKKLKKIIKETPGKFLPEAKSKIFLQEYDIPIVTTYLASNSNQAVQAAQKIGFPVVLKTQSPQIVHKTEAEGVLLNLQSEREVVSSFKKLTRDTKQYQGGVSVQKMVDGIDYELFLGAKRDPNFGPMIMFGHGGTEVELYQDVSMGLAPLSKSMARRIMKGTKIFKFLKQGFRNKKPVNIELLATILQNFSYLILDFPEIKEMDVNPLVIRAGQPLVLDARIMF